MKKKTPPPPRYLCGHVFKHDCHGAPPTTAEIEASPCAACQAIEIARYTGGLTRGQFDRDGRFAPESHGNLGGAVADPSVRLVPRGGKRFALCLPKRYAFAIAMRDDVGTFIVLYDPRGGNHVHEDSPGGR